jgi:hypothetical protein
MSHSDNSFMQSHFFTFSPSFTSWRMASESLGLSCCFSARQFRCGFILSPLSYSSERAREPMHTFVGEVTSASNGCEGWQAHTQNSLLG